MLEKNTTAKSMREQSALLSAIINSQKNIIIFALDKSYRYTAFNERHRDEMKKVWAADIALGMNLLDCMKDATLRELAKNSFDRALRGETFSEVQHQPEQNIYYELNWGPVMSGIEVVGVTAFVRDITERKRSAAQLEAKNIALREVLEQLEVEKSILQKNVQTNLEKLILPTLTALRNSGVSSHSVDLLQRNMEEIASSFGVNISNQSIMLSPKEIEVCSMIKGGYENKEIAKSLKNSVQTIEKHRKNVRRKLGIAHKKINLNTYLQNL